MPTDDPAGGELTIDELARSAGLIVSTIRLYQNRRLLPPPTKRGRVGYYGADHLHRLDLIGRLQQRGFSLAAIKELLDGLDAGASLPAALGLGDARTSPTWTPEQPVTMTLPELAERLPGVAVTPELVRRIVEMGLVSLGNEPGAVVVHSPTFLGIGSRLIQLGVPVEAVLDHAEDLRGRTAAIAAVFTDLFRTHLWAPAVHEVPSAATSAAIIQTLGELGALAEGVVVASLRQALQEQAESFVAAEAERLGIAIPRPGDSPPSAPAR